MQETTKQETTKIEGKFTYEKVENHKSSMQLTGCSITIKKTENIKIQRYRIEVYRLTGKDNKKRTYLYLVDYQTPLRKAFESESVSIDDFTKKINIKFGHRSNDNMPKWSTKDKFSINVTVIYYDQNKIYGSLHYEYPIPCEPIECPPPHKKRSFDDNDDDDDDDDDDEDELSIQDVKRHKKNEVVSQNNDAQKNSNSMLLDATRVVHQISDDDDNEELMQKNLKKMIINAERAKIISDKIKKNESTFLNNRTRISSIEHENARLQIIIKEDKKTLSQLILSSTK